AEIAVMGPEGAVNILYRRELEAAADPQAFREAKIREYREKFANPYVAAERGYVDEVIEPRDTRVRLTAALALLRTKRDSNPPRKHGNIPLCASGSRRSRRASPSSGCTGPRTCRWRRRVRPGSFRSRAASIPPAIGHACGRCG